MTKNVAEVANPPRNARAGTEMNVWTAEQLAEFLRGIETHRLYPAYLLAATTGMRRGEILGLKWSNVDLEAKTVWVRETLISVGYKVRLSQPKTSRSRRSIALDDETVAVLRQLKRRQVEERLRMGPGYHDDGLVFTDEYGNHIHPDRFSKIFEKVVMASGLPRIRLHDLRHTWATLALQSGVHVKMVSERLGACRAIIVGQVLSRHVGRNSGRVGSTRPEPQPRRARARGSLPGYAGYPLLVRPVLGSPRL